MSARQASADRHQLSDEHGNHLDIHPQGAHVTSWVCAGLEQLYLSSRSRFETGKAIRGGVPIIFPQFATRGNGPRHGFARTSAWQPQLSDRADTLRFALRSDARSRALWPFEFELLFSARLLPRGLNLSLDVFNSGRQELSFSAALHSYWRVDALPRTQLHGLSGLSYWDNGWPLHQRSEQQDEMLQPPGGLDRIYFAATQPLRLVDGVQSRCIHQSGFRDVVVWNPGSDGSRTLDDMPEAEHSQFVCIEAAAIEAPIRLPAGGHWQGSQSILVEPHQA